MAILSGINTRMKGSLGDWTFSRHDGKTVASQKVERKSTPTRKKSQMRLRTQLSNLVNLFRAFGQTLHPSFEKRKSGASDFNEFVRANLGAVPVYLTKSEAKQGGSVVAGYLVTLGTLPSINVTMGAGDVATTDISLGSMSITASTTLKAFSNAVVNNNRDYEYGDQISAFIATQTVNSESHVAARHCWARGLQRGRWKAGRWLDGERSHRLGSQPQNEERHTGVNPAFRHQQLHPAQLPVCGTDECRHQQLRWCRQ